jgi:hypothetical protein
MREILRTNDVVVLSFAHAVLSDAGIEVVQADTHMSVMEGSIGMFPRRVLVLDEDWSQARAALQEAGLGDWLILP